MCYIGHYLMLNAPLESVIDGGIQEGTVSECLMLNYKKFLFTDPLVG